MEASTSGPALFKHTEEHFKKHLKCQFDYLHGKRVTVLSHAPPFGILDRGIRFAEEDEFTHHIGSKALRNFVKANPVDLVVCGHCHSQGGRVEKLKNMTIVNVASHDDRSAKGRFAVITLTKNGIVEIEWHSTCEALGKDSLTQIYGIGTIIAERLLRSGIKTVSEYVNYHNLAKLSSSTRLSQRFLKLLQLRGESLLTNKIYQFAPFKVETKNAIFFDIETDIACRRVWLIGLLVGDQFSQFYADSWDEEKEILSRFEQLLADHPDKMLISFSGTNFDYRVTLGAMQRHGIETDCLTNRSHIDLSILLRRCFIFPNQRFALKDLGSYFNYPFKYADLDGLAVALAYHKHAEDRVVLDERVFDYNADDVKVLPFLVSKALAVSAKLQYAYRTLPETSATDGNITGYTCPKCGHFHSSKYVKRRPPKDVIDAGFYSPVEVDDRSLPPLF